MKRETLTCDVCRRELPLMGVGMQMIRTVKRRWFADSAKLDPEHVCEQCWDKMVDYVREPCVVVECE